MASLWDTLVEHVRSALPSHQAVNSAGEALFRAPFDAAGFLGDVPYILSNLPSTVREGRDLIEGNKAAAKKEAESQYAVGDGPASRLARKVHNAIHQDTAPAQTTAQKYVDAALEGGPPGVAGQAAEDYLPDTWWKPAAVAAAQLAAGVAVPVVGKFAKDGIINTADLKPIEPEAPTAAPVAPDGLPGNGSVRPMDPREIASIMNDHAAIGKAPQTISMDDLKPVAPLPDDSDRVFDISKADDLRKPVISITQDEQPTIQEQAATNDALAPAEEAVAPEPRQYKGFTELPKQDPDGTKYLTYTTKSGDTIPIKMGIEPDGTAEMAIDQFGHGQNKIGPSEIRSAMHDLMEMYPEIKSFGGYRRSGAGAGRVQEIIPPAVIPHPAAELPDIIRPESDPIVARQELSPASYPDTTATKIPPAPANDVNRLDAAKNFVKNIMADESGVKRFADQDPANPDYPEAFYKLAQALREGVPARNKQEGMYHAELQKRVAEMGKIRQAASGIESLYAEKSALKGKLPTVQDYEGMSGLSQEDLNQLFDHIKNHPRLGWLQSINAREGLSKILQGEVPTSSEITLLARTMPPELIRDLMKNRSLWKKIMEGAVSTLNVPRALMASYDVSAPLRQGVFMIGRKEWWTALGPMLKAFAMPKYANEVRESIYRDALYPVMSDSGLAIPVYENHNGGPIELREHEEPFMTDLAGKIPLVGVGVRASERAFNTFVYKLRADTFKSIYNDAREGGKSWDKQSTKDLSTFINSFTGRGKLPGKFEDASALLNTALFSPKLLKSRVDALNPAFYGRLDPTVRKEAFKSISSFVAIAATVIGLAKLSGAEVGSDPRTADGWKIKIGNTRYDILGGEQQLVRLMANIATYSYQAGKELTQTGKIHMNEYKDKTAADNIGQFFRNKESPDVSLAHDFLSGRTDVGDDFSAKSAAIERVTPLSAGDAEAIYEDQINQGVPPDKALAKAIAMASPGLLGVNVGTYDHKPGGKKGNPFKNPFGGNAFKTDFKEKF